MSDPIHCIHPYTVTLLITYVYLYGAGIKNYRVYLTNFSDSRPVTATECKLLKRRGKLLNKRDIFITRDFFNNVFWLLMFFNKLDTALSVPTNARRAQRQRPMCTYSLLYVNTYVHSVVNYKSKLVIIATNSKYNKCYFRLQNF